MQVLNNPNTEDWIYRNVLSNYKFYAEPIVGLSDYPVLQYQGLDEPDFVSSTPSIVIHDDKIVFNVRYVNYRIDEQGGYVQKEKIVTKNRMFSMPLSEWYKEIRQYSPSKYFRHDSTLLEYNQGRDNDVYVGLEDVHLFSFKSQLLYTANRGLSYDNIVVESGIINDDAKVTFSDVLKNPHKQNSIEKNWVLFDAGRNQPMCVYQWHPLTIGECSVTSLTNVVEYEVPAVFRHLRGSTPGVRVGDEIWFLTHMVSYEDRRFYYHMLVAIDMITFKVLRYSRLFTFEKEKVEYTLGMVYDRRKDMFTIGYSTMDSSTKFILISKEKISGLFL
jgi:hypothetical protein